MVPSVFSCPSCGAAIQNGSPSCPSCRYFPPQFAAPRPRGSVSSARHIIGLLVLAFFVGLPGGFVHIVYGNKTGDPITICAKDGWALEDTFVDVNDYVGVPLLALLPKAKVVRALFACNVLEKPEFLKKRESL